MANIASQKKRILRTEREHEENRRLKGAVKTHFRRLESAVESGDAETIETEHRSLISRTSPAIRESPVAMLKNAVERPRRLPRSACSSSIAGDSGPGSADPIAIPGSTRSVRSVIDR